MGQAGFMLCTGFIFMYFYFYFFLFCRLPDADLHLTNSLRVVETLILEKCYRYCFLDWVWNIFSFGFTVLVFIVVCKIYFLLVFSKRWIQRDIKYAKKEGIMSTMECADIPAFTFATWQRRSCLLWKFIVPEVSVISSFVILRVVLCLKSLNSYKTTKYWKKYYCKLQGIIYKKTVLINCYKCH